MHYSIKSKLSWLFLIGLGTFAIYEYGSCIQTYQRIEYINKVHSIEKICRYLETKVEEPETNKLRNTYWTLDNINQYLEAENCLEFIDLYNQKNDSYLSRELCNNFKPNL